VFEITDIGSDINSDGPLLRDAILVGFDGRGFHEEIGQCEIG